MAQPQTHVQNPRVPRGESGESTQYERNLAPRPLITDPSQRPVIPHVKPQPRIDDSKFEGVRLGVVEKYRGFEHVDNGKPEAVEYLSGDVVTTNGRHCRWLLTDSPGNFVRLPGKAVWNATLARAFLSMLQDSVSRGLAIPTYEQFKADLDARQKARSVAEEK